MKTLVLLCLFTSCVFAGNGHPLPTADYVDIERYIGKWNAITALPQFFTRSCRAQTAEYGIVNAQTISVVNTCLKEGTKTTVITGEAVVANAATNAELIVTFNNFFTRLFRVKGDYTIIKLDPEYRYVLVGSKDRKSLWLLAREKAITEAVLKEYVAYAEELGFPTKKLEASRF